MSQLNTSKIEHWLPVAGFEGFYSVSNFGRVRSESRVVQRAGKPMRIRERLLAQNQKRTGHRSVFLYGEDARQRLHVHRLVVLAFVGPPPSDVHEVAHNDGDATNNRIENLRWATRSENHGDKVQHGTHNRGERHPLARLSDGAVRNIRSSTLTNAQLAELHGVGAKHVWAIRSNKSRKFL